jgi:uncharacterized repeat protein (TIGR01451 family)
MSPLTSPKSPSLRLLLLAALSWLLVPPAEAQISLNTVGVPATEGFDVLASAGTNIPWTDNTTVAGFYSTRTTYNSGTGGTNTGAMYSFGVAGQNPVTDRALGGVASGGTGTFFWAGRYLNNTGATLTSLDVAYTGEQWRDGGNAAPVAQTMVFQYQVANAGVITDADTPNTGWIGFPSLDFTSPIFTTVAGALDGNLAANRLLRTASLPVTVLPGQEIWIRWQDLNDAGNDHGLAVDDLSVTPQGGAGNAPVVPTCPASLTTVFGTPISGPISATDSDGTVTSAAISGITPSDPGTISITGFTPAAGVGGTASGTLSVSNTTPAASYSVSILWSNNDAIPQTATCTVAVTVNPPPVVIGIHDVQGSGPTTPIPPATPVTVQGVVVGNFQGSTKLQGFFLEEEDADADADPLTSEGIFIFCGGCPTAVAEGQRVQVTGNVSEFFGMTEMSATSAGSVIVIDAGNHLAEVTPAPIDLPVVGDVNAFYEAREGMLVTFVDPLFVSEYFELARFGQFELFEGDRPRQFTETAPPDVPGNTAHLEELTHRRVIVDDDNDAQNASLALPDGSQFIFHPRANGGFSIGTQGVDFFRGGDVVNGLTGVLHWSFSGVSGTDAWRIRPVAATPATFTVANPRPATAPAVGGPIKAASANMLNYFTTIDTTSSDTSGPCGPDMTQDCRGADSTAELDRQRDRASLVLCGLNADVAALMEMENTTPSDTITDLLGAVNTLCGAANPYAFVDTGGTLGTDAIRVYIIYRSQTLSPVGPPLVDLDPIHNRPPTAQTFDVIAPLNPALGQRFTVVANHFKSKGCTGATGADLDTGDGQGCFAARRTAQAIRLLDWLNTTVIPAASDPDVLLLGDFNSYAQETPTTTIEAGGFTDLESAFLGAAAYSYLFDAQLGHIDYAFSSSTFTPQIAGVGPWHINADEANLLDYNDEIKTTGEAAFEEKPDGSALVPPRNLFEPGTPYRASDHDPVLVGLFQVADLAVTMLDDPDPIVHGMNLTYTITLDNNGPNAAAATSWTDTLPDGPSGTTFVSLSTPPGWSCTTPPVGQGGTASCSNPSLAVGSAVFTLVVAVDPSLPDSILTNTVTATSTTPEGAPGNESATATTTVTTPVELLSFEVE